MYFGSGAKYVGQFKENKKHGSGIYTYPDGKKFIGKFLSDRPHGKGKKIAKSGKVLQEGEWENGKFIIKD